MSLRRKPHTAIVYSASQSVDTEWRHERPEYASGVAVAGQLTSVSMERVVRDTGGEIRNPHYFYCEVEDAPKFTEDSKVECLGSIFRVIGPAVEKRAGSATNYARVAMERLEYVPN